MNLEDKIAAALALGRSKAEEILALRAAAQIRRAAALEITNTDWRCGFRWSRPELSNPPLSSRRPAFWLRLAIHGSITRFTMC